MYKTAFKQTLSFVWRNKTLWILGIFASFLGTAEETELLRKITNTSSTQFFYNSLEQLWATNLFTKLGMQNVWHFIISQPLLFLQILAVISLIFSFVFLLTWLSLISQGAIVYAASHPELPLKNTSLLRYGIKTFWPICFLNIIAKILLGALFIAILYSFSLTIWIALPAIGILILFSLLLSAITKLSLLGIVIEKNGLFTAIKKAIILFKKNFFEVGGLTIALLLLTTVVMLLGVAAGIIILIPFVPIMEANIILKFSFGFTFAILLYVASATILVLLIFGFLSTISLASWAMLFPHLKNNMPSNTTSIRILKGRKFDFK